MNCFVKLPASNLDRWAPQWNWAKVFSLWRDHEIAGVILPVAVNDQLDNLPDISDGIIEVAREQGLQVWLFFAVLNNPVFSAQFSEDRPVQRDAKPLSFPAWFSPICPSSEHYRGYFLRNLKRLLPTARPDGIVVDYLRIPYFWEKWGSDIQSDQWPAFCYCHRCLSRFEQQAHQPLHEARLSDWLRWQRTMLMDWYSQIRQLLANRWEVSRIGLQVLPLRDKGNWSPALEWAGPPIAMVEKNGDFVSPLLYDRILNWSSDTLLSYLIDLMVRVRTAVVPAFQLSATQYDRKNGSLDGLLSLLRRVAPLNLSTFTLFHGRELLDKKVLKALKKTLRRR